MNAMLSKVEFLDSGYCRQFARMAGDTSWRIIRFYATFVYFEHPQHGACLIDSGYSQAYLDATRRLPERMMRWLLPAHIDASTSPALRLQRAGLDPARVRRLFVSHFHGDHIGGLKEFKECAFTYRRSTYQNLQGLSRREQLREGFLPDLLPGDFAARGEVIEENRFLAGSDLTDGFRVVDYWGDQSLYLVDLPGHALGHLGYLMKTDSGMIFYVVDACWHMDVLRAGGKLPWLAYRIQHDPSAYMQTQHQLRTMLAAHEDISMFACHCPQTMQQVPRDGT